MQMMVNATGPETVCAGKEMVGEPRKERARHGGAFCAAVSRLRGIPRLGQSATVFHEEVQRLSSNLLRLFRSCRLDLQKGNGSMWLPSSM